MLSPGITYTSIDEVLREASHEAYNRACNSIVWCEICRKLKFHSNGWPNPNGGLGWSELCITCVIELAFLCLKYEGGNLSFPLHPEFQKQLDIELMEYLDGIRS